MLIYSACDIYGRRQYIYRRISHDTYELRARVEINGNINFRNLRNAAVAEMSIKNALRNNARDKKTRERNH